MGAKLLWVAIGGFLTGVFVRSFHTVPAGVLGALLFGSFLCVIIGHFFRSSKQYLFFTVVFLACFSLGVLRMESAIPNDDPILHSLVGEKIEIKGVVVREPDPRESSVRLTVDIDTLIQNGGQVPLKGRVLIVAPAHTFIQYGDRVDARGTLDLPKAFESGAGREFNYPLYLMVDGIRYELSYAFVSKTGEYRGSPVQWGAIWFKQKYLDGLHAVLPEPYAGLAGGITVGDKRSVGPEISAMFQKVSLVHVLVLSGYNITIVLAAVTRMFFARIPRTFRLAVSLLVIVVMVLIAGGAASAARAGAMAFLAVYARVFGRLFLALRVLGFVALVMVAWNPFVLAFDPGFQLSVLATLGLVLFSESVARYCEWMPEKFGLREILSATIATQLTVLPLLLYQNGQLSIVALPANLLALIAVPAAMGYSVIAAGAGMILGVWGTFFAFPAYILLAYIIKIAEIAASLPYASVSLPAFSAWWLLLIYTSFLSLWYFRMYRPREAVPIPVVRNTP